MKEFKPEIKVYRKKYAIYAGVSRLSRLFKTLEEAQEELSNNEALYRMWSGSVSVSVENAPKKVLKA